MPRKTEEETKEKQETAEEPQKASPKKETKPAAAGKKEEKAAAAKKGRTGVEQNTKALAFQEFLVENNSNVFSTESLGDDYQTVLFRSCIETKGQILPFAVIIDTSIFTILRTQIVKGVTEDKRARIEHYLGGLNGRYKIFKYYLREDGSIYLDVCLPFTEESFDSRMVQLMISIIVQHLEATYDDLMAELWQKKETKDEK